MNIEVRILKNEKWWGGSVADGWKMPLTEKSEYSLDATINKTYNQFNGLFVSTKGRYIFFEGGGKITAHKGILSFEELQGIPTLGEGYGTLKNAYCAAAKKHFKKIKKNFNNVFSKPLYCTWAEMIYNPTQEKILNYADSIIQAELPKSCIIIDDGWMKGYGDWCFDEKKFHNPKEMVEKLHTNGFLVMLWIVPFVDENAPDYQILKENDALLKDITGNVRQIEWWNGKSAVLDLSVEFAKKWITTILDRFKSEYGIDSFKFDAGDAMYYETDEKNVDVNKQSELWAMLANEYPGSELRACVGLGGEPIMQRLCDKKSNFGEEGLGGLLGGVIQAGLCGYSYVCADMIGGGQISDFDNLNNADKNFFIRSCQMAVFFPIMQFSYAIWSINEELRKIVQSCCKIREMIEPYINRLMAEAETTSEPIVRPLEYEFPDYHYETSINMFLIGNRYLIVQTIDPGIIHRTLILPGKCRWKRNNGLIYEAGKTIELSIGLDEVCFFEQVD